uniref:7-dehydrocholesterol reductase n=1 Tax=Brassica oleracea var. oleracea TaxID=109376 RepID=A0A0D3CG03_BRAOL
MAETVHSPIVTFASMLSLLALCPPFVILLPARTIRDTDTLYELPCSLSEIFHSSGFLWENGVKGLINIWPRPTAIAWKIIFCYGAFEAALQLLLPGKRVEGPVSPTGNRPVYKDNGMAAYFVTLATYLGLWWVMLHLHQVILVHVGMELYPRIGKNFDIKVFTNCRFGMMSWAVLAVTYCIKQYEINGRVSDSMLVNTILMLVYVTKFFGWEAGYWNSMDIAHDRDKGKSSRGQTGNARFGAKCSISIPQSELDQSKVGLIRRDRHVGHVIWIVLVRLRRYAKQNGGNSYLTVTEFINCLAVTGSSYRVVTEQFGGWLLSRLLNCWRSWESREKGARGWLERLGGGYVRLSNRPVSFNEISADQRRDISALYGSGETRERDILREGDSDRKDRESWPEGGSGTQLMAGLSGALRLRLI